MSSKLNTLKARLGAKKLSDAVDEELTIVTLQVVEPRDEDGYTAVMMTDADGQAWRSTSAAVVDFAAQVAEVYGLGELEEALIIKPVQRTSKRGRDYLAIELVD